MLNFDKNKPDNIKKAYKYLLIFVTGYLVLFLAFYFLIQIASVQTYICQKIGNYLGEELETHIEIKGVKIDFFNSLVLKDLLVEDQQGDTLFYFNKLSVGLRYINRDFNKFGFSKLELEKGYFNWYSLDSTRTNLSFLLPESQDSGSALSFLKIAKLKLKDLRFSYHNYEVPDSGIGVNYDHLDISQLNLQGKQLLIKDTTTSIKINSLSLFEDNGFELQDLRTLFSVSPSQMAFKKLKVETERTDLEADFTMNYESFADFSNFIENVDLESDFCDALVSLKDLSYFVPDLDGLEQQVYLNGKVRGTVDNLSGREVRLFVNRETFIEGSFDLRGLPNFEDTYMYLDLKELKTNAKGLRSLPYPPFKEQNQLSVPQNIDQLGDMIFSGEFTGFYNDFVAYGLFKTRLGNVRTDLSLKENENSKFAYKGEIKSQDFQVGEFIDFQNLSSLGFDLKLSGTGINVNEIEASANGMIKHLTLNNYRYEDVKVDGTFTRQKFTGNLALNDENIAFDFKGIIDASRKKPLSKFDFQLYRCELAKLNLFQKSDTATQIKLNAHFDLEGSTIDDIAGYARITEIAYADSKLSTAIDSIQLNAEGTTKNRKLQLRSDLIDGEIAGSFIIEKIPETMLHYFEDYIPDAGSSEGFREKQDFNFNIRLKDVSPLTAVFIPDLKIDSNTQLSGQINTETHASKFKLLTSGIEYGGLRFVNPQLDLKSRIKNIGVNLKLDELAINQLILKNFDFNSNLEEGIANSQFSWSGTTSRSDSGLIKLETQFFSSQHTKTSILDSYFLLNDSVWTFSDSNFIEVNQKAITIDRFAMSMASQSLEVQGKISEEETDTMYFQLREIDLAYISKLVPDDLLQLEGVANGNASIQDVYNNFSLISDLSLSGLSINGTEVGVAFLKSTWNRPEQALLVKANLGAVDSRILSLNGKVYPLREENSLDLKLKLNELPIIMFKPYLTDVLSDLEGNIEGTIKIDGESDHPLLDGDLIINQAKFRIDYLNTSYQFSDKVFIRPDYIGFNLITIKDERGNTAVGTGTIFHDNYSDFNLDVGLELDNFLALNTNSTQNDLYYGTAIVSGDANISGYADQTIFEIKVKTEKGTDFSIPLTDGVDVSESDFLEFTNSPKKEEEKEEVDLTGIQLNFDLDIRPDAKVQIIFDEQVGDVIKGQGEGKLKLEINTIGNFNIYGQYIVQEGDYLFTLQNVINKKFKIAPGSRISWDGDPYRANIDIRAIYNLRASLFDIMPEDTTSNVRRRVPVELELQMTNQLLAPDINFDIRLPSSSDVVKQRLESILYVNRNDVNQQEMNQQVFGLLVLNRFLPPTSGVATDTKYDRGTPGVNNGYEFLSNQLSNWLSKMSDQFDIGVNYRPGDEITNDELDLSLSTEVFNDRLVLDGNLGYVSNNSNQETQNTSFIGEFSAEYKLSRDGRFRVRGFNRSTNNNLLQNNSPYTQGVGFFYREEFDTFNELWRRYFHESSKN